jgi:hypothetical protein
MNVLTFPRSIGDSRDWRQVELRGIVAGAGIVLSSGESSGWEVGVTEAGDPQFYLLGPTSRHDCLLTVTRLGCRYVLEDGLGKVLFEHTNLDVFTERMRIALRFRNKSRFMGQLLLAVCAIRTAFEERVEPVLVEPMEVLTHLTPQLTAFA